MDAVKIEVADVGTAHLAYSTFGKGNVKVVVETALSSASAEWWHISDKLSAKGSVLVYDRAGYGQSSRSKLPRTPTNIANELYKLLQYIQANDVILIGHSQGGLYAQQFARLHPESTCGLILLDPLSANDSQFKTRLSAYEFKRSGVDKTSTLKIAHRFCRLRLGFLFKSLLKKSAPFYYYDYDKQASEYLLSTLTKASHYQTALEEYGLAHDERELTSLKSKEGFPPIPLVLITHSSQVAIQEIESFGGLSEADAEKVEMLWQELMQQSLAFTPRSKLIRANRSSHYIHLTEPEILESALDDVRSFGCKPKNNN